MKRPAFSLPSWFKRIAGQAPVPRCPTQEVEALWGQARLYEGEPGLYPIKDAVFIPDHMDNWGLYGPDGVLAPGAGLYHGPERHLILTPAETSTAPLSAPAETIEDEVLYCGPVIIHYGHTLLSTFSRYWFAGTHKHKKILFHGPHPFALPYLKFWLESCGFSEGDFIQPDRPTRLRNIVVAAPSFEELLGGYKAFAHLCHRVAVNAGAVVKTNKSLPPVYLSKSRVSSGVSNLANEALIEEEMRAKGVPVVYPEQLSFVDQIRVFHEYPRFIGTCCSALHTSLFVEGGCRMVGLTYQNIIHSNYVIIDQLAGNRTQYLQGYLTQIETSPGFGQTFEAPDPKALAQDMLARSYAED